MTSVMKTAGGGETLVILSKRLCLCLRKKRYNHKEKWSLDSRLANKVDQSEARNKFKAKNQWQQCEALFRIF